MTIYMESDMHRVAITTEIGVKLNTKNITSYVKGRRMKEVARHKEITCKEYSHAKMMNDEKVSKVQRMIKE